MSGSDDWFGEPEVRPADGYNEQRFIDELFPTTLPTRRQARERKRAEAARISSQTASITDLPITSTAGKATASRSRWRLAGLAVVLVLILVGVSWLSRTVALVSIPVVLIGLALFGTWRGNHQAHHSRATEHGDAEDD